MKSFFFALFLLLSSIAYAGSVQCNFAYTNVIPVSNQRWINTDVSFNPGFSSSSTTVCVNNDVSLPIQVGTAWFTNNYDARLLSHATGPGCLIASPGSAQNAQVVWVSSDKFQKILDRDSTNGKMGSAFADMAAFNDVRKPVGHTCQRVP